MNNEVEVKKYSRSTEEDNIETHPGKKRTQLVHH